VIPFSYLHRFSEQQISRFQDQDWEAGPRKNLPFFSEIIPEMFQAAAEGKIKIETEDVDIKNIEAAGMLRYKAERGW
jgi:hypothetical protein